MKPLLLLTALSLAFCVAPLSAQQSKAPKIGYIYPAGGQAGTNFQMDIGGQFLEGTHAVLSNGDGIKATVTHYTRPLPPKRFNELRDYLTEARKSKKEDSALGLGPDRKNGNRAERVAEILKESGATDEEIDIFMRTRKEKNDPKRQQNTQLAETVTVQIEVAPDATPGPRFLRLLTPTGATNPLAFCVGRLAESSEPLGERSEAATEVRLPVVRNGQILPGEADRIRFQAKEGERIVVSVQARDLVPYLADAVPGWFQPVVSVLDENRRELPGTKAFRFRQDPAVCYQIPKTGGYTLEIRDALHRGREDFIYRVTIGAVPFVTGIFPLGGRVGEATELEVSGWNLPTNRAKAPAAKEPGTVPLPALANGSVTSDAVFANDRNPVVLAREPDNDPEHARAVELPVSINGKIEVPGDTDVFAIPCKVGQRVVAEVLARRLNSPVDSWLRVTDASGKQIAFADDLPDAASGLLTHHADARLEFVAPADGRYFVRIGETQRQGGPDYFYRLRVGAPEPGFSLRFTPSAINAKAGSSVPVTLHALRRDGFAGEIRLSLKDAPEGFSLDGGIIPPGVDKVPATITVPFAASGEPVPLTIEGRSKEGGKEIVVRATPADDLLQAFIYHHLVPAPDLLAVVFGNRPNIGQVSLLSESPVKIPAGGTGKIVVARRGRAPFTVDETRLQLVDAPKGLSVEGPTRTEGGAAIAIRADSSKCKPGTRGNLLIEVAVEKTKPAEENKKREKIRYVVGFLPAIPFEIVPGPNASPEKAQASTP